MGQKTVSSKIVSLQVTQKVESLHELYEQLYMEWMDFSDRIDFCAKDSFHEIHEMRAALGLIKDTSANAYGVFSDLNEEINKAFRALMGPSCEPLHGLWKISAGDVKKEATRGAYSDDLG